jgi:hypothetical protein
MYMCLARETETIYALRVHLGGSRPFWADARECECGARNQRVGGILNFDGSLGAIILWRSVPVRTLTQLMSASRVCEIAIPVCVGILAFPLAFCS